MSFIFIRKMLLTSRLKISSFSACHFLKRQLHKSWPLASTSDFDVAQNLEQFGLDKIRNFSIVAHIDHGKSTLADRILEHVGAIPKSETNKQVLDKLPVERQRGITVKAQTASVVYEYRNEKYLLNLIDTPGHVDFSSEVSKSLSSSQGVILLVDANQGVQAQTVSNFYLAFGNGLKIIPVVNKVDLPQANPDGVIEQLFTLFEIDPEDVIKASAKTGQGLTEILDAVVARIPCPENYGKSEKLRVLLQDSWYDQYKGAVNLVQVFDGKLRVKQSITSLATQKSYVVKSVAILTPEEKPVAALGPGQIGVITCNMRSPADAVIGDTFCQKDEKAEPIIEISVPKPMVYAGVFPKESKEYNRLKSAIEKVSLNDSSVSVSPDSSLAFGNGWRLGFLGLLHMEVFAQRLKLENDAEVIMTLPSVPYKIRRKKNSCSNDDQAEILVTSAEGWIEKPFVEAYLEPWVKGTIIFPTEYKKEILSLCHEYRGKHLNTDPISDTREKMEWLLPLNEIVTDFFDHLKHRTSGYGSFDYEDAGFEESQLVKVDILLNDSSVPELAMICHLSRAREKGKEIVSKLTETMPRQQFQVKVQAAVGKKIIARDNIKCYRKDVTAKLYGGDLTRRMKLLANQKEGKIKLKQQSMLHVPKETFLKIFERK